MIVQPDITNAKNGFEYNLGQKKSQEYTKIDFFYWFFPLFLTFSTFYFFNFVFSTDLLLKKIKKNQKKKKNKWTKVAGLFLQTFSHLTFQFFFSFFFLSVPRDSFPVRETFLGLCPVLNFYFSPLLLWYRSIGPFLA